MLSILPATIGLDEQTEFQAFILALVSTFALVLLGRLGLAGLAYGLACGAMPFALFSVVMLLAILAEAVKSAGLDQVPIPLPAARAPITVGRRV